jgi:hypothetical protein
MLWPTIIAVVLLAVLAAILAIVVLGGAGGTPEGSGDPSGDTSPTPVATGASPSPDEASSPGESASDAPETGFALDAIVATAVDALTLRETPGLEGPVQWRLPEGTLGFVIAGPVETDGLSWYQLSGMGLPYASGCVTPPPGELLDCPAWLGWLAAEADDGTAYLTAASAPPCEEPPATVVSLSEQQYTLRLICFDAEPLTFTAWWPEAPDDGLGGACVASETDIGWLACPSNNGIGADDSESGDRLAVTVDPATGVEMPERGQWVEVTGHFDDPAAQRCGEVAEQMSSDPGELVFNCRLQFVLSEVAPTSAP